MKAGVFCVLSLHVSPSVLDDDQRGSGAASGPHHDHGLQEIHHRQDVPSAQEEGDAVGAGVFGLQCSVRGVGHVHHPDQDR